VPPRREGVLRWWYPGFRVGLREVGHPGQNITVEYRYAAGDAARLRALATELVRLKVAVLVAETTLSAQAAQRETRDIPIVMAPSGNPVGTAWVASLAHPEGNVTGLSATSADVSEARRLRGACATLATTSPASEGGRAWKRNKPSGRSSIGCRTTVVSRTFSTTSTFSKRLSAAKPRSPRGERSRMRKLTGPCARNGCAATIRSLDRSSPADARRRRCVRRARFAARGSAAADSGSRRRCHPRYSERTRSRRSGSQSDSCPRTLRSAVSPHL
jgi:ABC transporter substrate binding protein